jgi:hypothetical protein
MHKLHQGQPRSQGVAGLPAGLGLASNIVIVRAGRNSLHEGWLEHDGERGFDLLIAAYEPTVEAREASQTARVLVPGPTIGGYARIFRLYPELLRSYEFIGLFDDDLIASQEDIERLFRVGRAHNLDLFQPALSWDSHFSYAATLAQKGYRLRFTNAVEMMCPVFSASHLQRALPLFELGYETGVDLLWTRLTDNPWFRYAIVDEVVFNHTRAVGTTKVLQGFASDERYDRKVQEVLDRFGASFRGFVSYAAIDSQGQAVMSRTAIALRSIGTWAALIRTPLPSPIFARLAPDFTRHCLLRPVNLRPIDLAAGEAGRSAPHAGKYPEFAR